MKTAIIIACIALLISAFFLLRKLFYHLVDKRIAGFRVTLSASRLWKYRICTVRCRNGGTITAIIFKI